MTGRLKIAGVAVRPNMTRIIKAIFATLLLIAACNISCATTSAVVQKCEATSLQAQQILDKLGSSSVPAVAIAAVDALKFGCAVAGEVDSFIAAHETDAGMAFMAADDPMDARRLVNARAWRAAHP